VRFRLFLGLVLAVAYAVAATLLLGGLLIACWIGR
jgi:hypothetical protein